jgi:hypothetical protein
MPPFSKNRRKPTEMDTGLLTGAPHPVQKHKKRTEACEALAQPTVPGPENKTAG